MTIPIAGTLPDPAAAPPAEVDPLPVRGCLNCGARLAGAYCAACGQREVDMAAPSWRVVRDAVREASDVDGRAARTARGLFVPGFLTAEHFVGRRAPYFGPLKLFFIAAAALTSTWILTRKADAAFYGLPPYDPTAPFIRAMVRNLLPVSLALAAGHWLLTRRKRRLVEEAVFALHLLSALMLFASGVIWLGTAWKVSWGSPSSVPAGVPDLPYLLYLPALLGGLAYVALATRRIDGGRWWTAVGKAVVLAAIATAAVGAALFLTRPPG